MPNFDPIQVILTTANGARTVTDVTLRWKGKEDFALDGPPQGAPKPLNPAQPFSLDLAPYDPTSRYRVAKLKFDPAAYASWETDAFDPWLMLVQKIRVTDVGPKDLVMNLSCTEHQQQVAHFLARVAIHVAEASAAIATTAVQFLKQTFGKPEQIPEAHAHEAHELEAHAQKASPSPN